MFKKYTTLFISACSVFYLSCGLTAFADITSSTVTGEIISGDFSIVTPNDLDFSTHLTGQKQQLCLKPIQTKITDYRG